MICSTVPHHFSNEAIKNAVTPSDRFYVHLNVQPMKCRVQVQLFLACRSSARLSGVPVSTLHWAVHQVASIFLSGCQLSGSSTLAPYWRPLEVGLSVEGPLYLSLASVPVQAHYQAKRDSSPLAMRKTADWLYQMTLCYPQHIPYQSKTCLINQKDHLRMMSVFFSSPWLWLQHIPDKYQRLLPTSQLAH